MYSRNVTSHIISDHIVRQTIITHASCFACKQFSRSISNAHGRRIFPLFGISRLRKWLSPCISQLALSLQVIMTVALVYHVRVWVISYFLSDLSNVIRNLPRIRTSILAAMNLLVWKTLWVNNRFHHFITNISLCPAASTVTPLRLKGKNEDG